jgi:hypothetical protein
MKPEVIVKKRKDLLPKKTRQLRPERVIAPKPGSSCTTVRTRNMMNKTMAKIGK